MARPEARRSQVRGTYLQHVPTRFTKGLVLSGAVLSGARHVPGTFLGKRIGAEQKAASYHPRTNMQNGNLAWIEHFCTRESGHVENLRESMIKIVSSYRN